MNFNPSRITIIAPHPDDETIFGGALLLMEPKTWKVIVITNGLGCSATSNTIAVTIITVSVPASLSTTNIELTKATMNWGAVANGHHYDIRMRVQGSPTWTINLNNLYGTSTI